MESYHVQRDVELKNATIIVYGNISEEEKNLFKKLVDRNSHNMLFENYKILFVQEEDLNNIVRKEVLLWGN